MGFFWLQSGQGCQACGCSQSGSLSQSCDEQGRCQCVEGVAGDKCDHCSHGYYSFHGNGCTGRPVERYRYSGCWAVRSPISNWLWCVLLACTCDHTGGNCSPESGECICPPHTEGDTCNTCEMGYWGHDPVTGCKVQIHTCTLKYTSTPNAHTHIDLHKNTRLCLESLPIPKISKFSIYCSQLSRLLSGHHMGRSEWVNRKWFQTQLNISIHRFLFVISLQPCSCSTTGSSAPQCELTNGTCQCKPGFSGRSCDQCAPGYHGYPACSACGCDVAGTNQTFCNTTLGVCDCQHNGECVCKVMCVCVWILTH